VSVFGIYDDDDWGVPLNTIWKRLHVARREIEELVERFQRGYDPTATISAVRGKANLS
jgi:hypothetical protein